MTFSHTHKYVRKMFKLSQYYSQILEVLLPFNYIIGGRGNYPFKKDIQDYFCIGLVFCSQPNYVC